MPSAPPDIALLTNPTAGKGRGARARTQALARFRAAGRRVRDLQGADADQALELAEQAVRDGVSSLVVVGGDGMVHLGAQACASSATTLGVIPAGTGNDFARYLDVPRTDTLAAADRILAGRTRSVDVVTSGGRHFVTVLAAGFDALVNERANRMRWPRGQMRYNLATLLELRTLQPVPYSLELDGVRHEIEAVLVAVGNGPSFGGGLRITEGAAIDDGLLDVVIIGPLSRRELARTYPKLFSGTHVTHPQYSHHRLTSVTVGAPGITAYADGERFGRLPLTLTCSAGALRVHH
ncbi:MAG: YegS/Rv2252/BmrU family lipid kinase [Nocardioides sp.]